MARSPGRSRSLVEHRLLVILLVGLLRPSADAVLRSPDDLKALTLEQLLDIKVISGSRTLEEWKTTPAAITVLPQSEIHRSGATRLAEALRLAPGLNVSRYVGSSYAISARGFSSASSNKLQVNLDGRSLYTPLFSGVFWEATDTFLEDVDRIEVARGPGATLWGANAFNGVINIITKNARETQGVLITGAAGNEERAMGGFRYGGKIGDSTYYRVYGRYQERDDQVFSNGTPNGDGMEQSQGGFRMDSQKGDDQFTLQGDLYFNAFDIAGRADAKNSGGNLLGRWTHTVSPNADFQVQVYYDRGYRDVPLQFREDRRTLDLDLQQHLRFSEVQELVFGGNYRNSADKTGQKGRTFVFSPPNRTLSLYSFFVQDQITLQPDRLVLTLGSKLEHNDYCGWELQPNLRLAYTPRDRQVVWAAVSRAVRAPTRVDTDSRFIPIPANGFVFIQGTPTFESEEVLAYELGYRVQPHPRLFLNLAAFYNDYSHLRTLEPSVPGGFPLLIKNEREGHAWGGEATVTWQATDFWRLSGSFSYLRQNLQFLPGSRDPTQGNLEANDPPRLATLRSEMTLPRNIEFDWTLHYAARLPNPALPAYLTLDARLAFHPADGWEIALVGQNLLDDHHPEFPGGASQPEVQRGFYVQFTRRY